MPVNLSALGRVPHKAIVAIFLALIAAAVVLGAMFAGPREPEPVGGPEMLRRLTEEQYRASIEDIFGPEIPVNARFEVPLRAEGLIAVGTGQSGMSPFSMEQYDAAAEGIAAAVLAVGAREEFVPCVPATQAEFDRSCAETFVSQTGRLLFRRPLTEDEVALYVDAASQGYQQGGDFYAGLQMSLYAMLMAPDFLFRLERVEPGASGQIAELDAYSKASRLSFFLTNSAPDAQLLDAAENGDLDRWWGVNREVNRLMDSPRFEGAIRAFFSDMLHFEELDAVSKDPAIYPAFTSDVTDDAREQTLRTIVHVLLDEGGDYRDLFTTREAFLTRALGAIYRVPVTHRGAWEVSTFPQSSRRAGIQSHISFLALHSHPGRSSPTLRGYAMREVFLCQEVPDPPANVNFTAVEESAHEGPTTARDRLVLHNTQPACAGCHKVMDPLGFSLENFDGIGTWRTHEGGLPIDTSGSLDGSEFADPGSLANALHDHREVPRCLAEKMYKSAVGRDITWDERPYLDWLIATFEEEDYRVPDLMRAIATSDNFFAVRPQPRRMVSNSYPNGDS